MEIFDGEDSLLYGGWSWFGATIMLLLDGSVEFSTFRSGNYFLMILCRITNQIHYRIIVH